MDEGLFSLGGTKRPLTKLPPSAQKQTVGSSKSKPIPHRSRRLSQNAIIIAICLLGFVVILCLASCATPKVALVPCPAFPAPPVVTLPETGSFRQALTSTLQNASSPKLTAPITP